MTYSQFREQALRQLTSGEGKQILVTLLGRLNPDSDPTFRLLLCAELQELLTKQPFFEPEISENSTLSWNFPELT